MKTLSTSCQILSALTAFAAAWFWWLSAQGDVPPETWKGEETKLWLDRAASRNRKAAIFAGISAFLGGTGAISGL